MVLLLIVLLMLCYLMFFDDRSVKQSKKRSNTMPVDKKSTIRLDRRSSSKFYSTSNTNVNNVNSNNSNNSINKKMNTSMTNENPSFFQSMNIVKHITSWGVSKTFSKQPFFDTKVTNVPRSVDVCIKKKKYRDHPVKN